MILYRMTSYNNSKLATQPEVLEMSFIRQLELIGIGPIVYKRLLIVMNENKPVKCVRGQGRSPTVEQHARD